MNQKNRDLVFHESTGKAGDTFIGIKALGNKIEFSYPSFFDFRLDAKDWRKQIIAIISSLKIAKTQSKETSSIYKARSDSQDFALNSYLWIINDWLNHGLYRNVEKIFRHDASGRIDWKRTLQTTPSVSKNGNVVYLNFVSQVSSPVDNLIVEIHKFCVKKSIDYIGWLFGLDSSSIETAPFNSFKKVEYISMLDSELEKTFDDDKKELFAHMKDVILGLDSSQQNNDFVYGVDNYYYVYERMVDYLFNGETDISKYYPKGMWKLVNRPTPFDSSNLRPDSIFLHKNNGKTDVYILDSKYYEFGLTGNICDLPETTSIQKQITYGEYIKKNFKALDINKIFNVFVLPYRKSAGPYKSDKNLQYIGIAYSTWKGNETNEDVVYAFLLDLKYLVMTWYLRNRSDENDVLILEISKHLEDYKEEG